MTGVERCVRGLTPALVVRVVRALAAERGDDQAGIAVEVIAHRLLDLAGAAPAPRERTLAVEALAPRIAEQVANIEGLRYIHND